MKRKGVIQFLVRHRLKIVAALVAGCTTVASASGVQTPLGIALATLAAMLTAAFMHQGATVRHANRKTVPVVPVSPEKPCS